MSERSGKSLPQGASAVFDMNANASSSKASLSELQIVFNEFQATYIRSVSKGKTPKAGLLDMPAEVLNNILSYLLTAVPNPVGKRQIGHLAGWEVVLPEFVRSVRAPSKVPAHMRYYRHPFVNLMLVHPYLKSVVKAYSQHLCTNDICIPKISVTQFHDTPNLCPVFKLIRGLWTRCVYCGDKAPQRLTLGHWQPGIKICNTCDEKKFPALSASNSYKLYRVSMGDILAIGGKIVLTGGNRRRYSAEDIYKAIEQKIRDWETMLSDGRRLKARERRWLSILKGVHRNGLAAFKSEIVNRKNK